MITSIFSQPPQSSAGSSSADDCDGPRKRLKFVRPDLTSGGGPERRTDTIGAVSSEVDTKATRKRMPGEGNRSTVKSEDYCDSEAHSPVTFYNL